MEIIIIVSLSIIIIVLLFVISSKNKLMETNEIIFSKKELLLQNTLTEKERSEKNLQNQIFQLQSNISQFQIDFNASNDKNTSLQERISELKLHIEKLSEYQTILDVNEYASKIITKAKDEVFTLLTQANEEYELIIKKANELNDNNMIEVKNLKEKTKAESELLINKAELIIKSAALESRTIIENANKKAEEIAGEAFSIKQNADKYERIVKAMKNIVEGYGDQYIIPTFSLLDDLAEEFGHTEAGQKLGLAREYSKMMVKNGIAATCKYVEKNRRETAIQFVLDAFNGKVDSILSKVKKDNYGTLQQKINDAFELVNMNGTAFRDAVITQEYLNSRLEELKWSVIAQELKWEEQEEQRRIKEQIREEERARREYEKAIIEAQKNEETLKKLIDKAQKEIEQANEDQKQKYESKLTELEQKLKEAEEKNQRALSLAQQTKAGNVYIISNIGSFGENVYKIGLTRRLEPLDRIRELGDASVPFEFDVHAMIFSEDAPTLEKELHKKFLRMQMNKVNPRKEFFKLTLKEIREEVDTLCSNTKWTMSAAAREYKESLAIERAMQTDLQKQKEWEKFQISHQEKESETIEEII